ncbi:hypothetical protein X757_31910 [Mesorhizobium sp. LSHC414A00]|nr:hypothetical protein X757_31910 [Mesorhizobium sp. LSHC414A00]
MDCVAAKARYQCPALRSSLPRSGSVRHAQVGAVPPAFGTRPDDHAAIARSAVEKACVGGKMSVHGELGAETSRQPPTATGRPNHGAGNILKRMYGGMMDACRAILSKNREPDKDPSLKGYLDEPCSAFQNDLKLKLSPTAQL